MIETQTNAHILINYELRGPSANLLESCKGNSMIMNMNRGQSVDTAAPFESVKDAIGKFKGLVKWENNSSTPTEDGLRLNSPTDTSSRKITGSDSSRRSGNAVGQIDTAAPIKSVKAAANKFGRSDSQPNSPTQIERQKSVDSELEKLQEELLDQKKESEAAETAKENVLTELESVSMLVQELQLNLEREESQETQAQQDCMVAQRNLRETKLEVSRSSIYARSWSKLQAAKERIEDELNSAKRELESADAAHDAIVAERDAALRKTEEYYSESMAMEKSMEFLRSELGSTKESTELARSAYVGAVESKVAAAAEFELDKSNWEMEKMRAENELAELEAATSAMNDLRSRVESSSASLRGARSELSSFVEAREARENELELELETANLQVEKTNGDIDYLQGAVSPLRSATEREKSAMAATAEKEASASAKVPALQGEIESTEAEIQLVLRREKMAREKAEDDLPEALDQAKEEANLAKSTAKSAGEEAKKAEAEAELAKASATATEKRLDATVKETQATKASATMVSSTATAMKQSRHVRRGRKKGVAIPVEEYAELRRKAGEAEELARNRVTAAAEQVKEAKELESRVQQELKEAARAIQARGRALLAEVEETERKKAEARELQERKPPARHGSTKMKSMMNMMRSLSGPVKLEEAPAAGGRGSPETTRDRRVTRSSTIGEVEETERKKAEVRELREWKPPSKQGSTKMKSMANMMRSLSGPVKMENTPAAGGRGNPETTPDRRITRSNTMGAAVGGAAAKPTTKRKSKMTFPVFSMLWGKKKSQPPPS